MWAEVVLRWLGENERSQAWLAGKVGVSVVHLNRCINRAGRSRPSRDLLARMEVVMGLPAGTLRLEADVAA